MKQNQKSLSYFTIGETFQCFIKSLAAAQSTGNGNSQQQASVLVEESDIVNHILQEMVNQKLAEATDGNKLAVDYTDLYTILEAMQLLGLVQRKTDTTCAQKFLTWTGFPKFRRKFDGVVSLHRYFAVWPTCGVLDAPVPYTRTDMEGEIKYQASTAIEKFLFELLFRMMRNEDRVITKAEIY